MGGFSHSGIVPYSPEKVLYKLQIVIHEPTPACVVLARQAARLGAQKHLITDACWRIRLNLSKSFLIDSFRREFKI